MTSDFIQVFRKADNPAGAASRHPITRKIHYRGITCSGPSEEWCVDGHETIALQMGISVWGIIDKFSRMELGLWAVPNERNRNVPPTLFLYTVKKFGGQSSFDRLSMHILTSFLAKGFLCRQQAIWVLSKVSSSIYRMFSGEFLFLAKCFFSLLCY